MPISYVTQFNVFWKYLYMQLTVNGEHGTNGAHAQGRVMVAGELVPVKC